MRSLARDLLPCTEQCVTAISPAETCRCTVCLGVHHGVLGRSSLHQVELFTDATGATSDRPESQLSELPPELHRDEPATAGVDGGGVTTTCTGVGRALPGPAAEGPHPDPHRADEAAETVSAKAEAIDLAEAVPTPAPDARQDLEAEGAVEACDVEAGRQAPGAALVAAGAVSCGCGRVHLTPPITPLCECGRYHQLRYRGRCAHCIGH